MKARRPRWALAEILLLVPYAGWVAFATPLNGAIARRNPKGLA